MSASTHKASMKIANVNNDNNVFKLQLSKCCVHINIDIMIHQQPQCWLSPQFLIVFKGLK